MNYSIDELITDSKNVFDMVYSKANTTVSSAFNASKAYVEKAQLRVKLKEKYLELGKLCYNMHESGADETGNMKKVIKEIKVLEAELELADETMGKPKVCSVCGNRNSADDSFCAKCGEKL